MSQGEAPFSVRQGYVRPNGVLYRSEIPVPLRSSLLEILQWYGDPSFLWQRVGRLFNGRGSDKLLRSLPPLPGASAAENHLRELRHFVASCPWYFLYDLIEDIFSQLASGGLQANPDAGTASFQRDINDYFVHSSIGWQMAEGKVVTRTEKALAGTVKTAITALNANGRATAAEHLQEALEDLSQRPEPNLRDAMVHAMGALQCTARDFVGDPRLSMEEILRLHSTLLPGPVGKALSLLWDYAMKQGHVWGYKDSHAWYLEEDREPVRDEVEMIVGLAAAISTYLGRQPSRDNLVFDI